MSELSSGHGGDFELKPTPSDSEETILKPNLEFTLPLLHKMVSFDGGTPMEATPEFPDVSDSRHPNKRPVQPHRALPIDDDHTGSFIAYHPDEDNFETPSKNFQPQHYAVKYVRNAFTDTTIEILGKPNPDGSKNSVVEFNFQVAVPNTYVVLVIYNFREILVEFDSSGEEQKRAGELHPAVPEMTLSFPGFSGDPRLLHRICYVYIVAANSAHPDPQKLLPPQNPPDPEYPISLKSPNLKINLTNLVPLMGGNLATDSISDDVQLYYTPASSINHTHLDVGEWEVEVVHVPNNKTASTLSGIEFNVAPNSFLHPRLPELPTDHIPLGLYMFHSPTDDVSQEPIAVQAARVAPLKTFVPIVVNPE